MNLRKNRNNTPNCPQTIQASPRGRPAALPIAVTDDLAAAAAEPGAPESASKNAPPASAKWLSPFELSAAAADLPFPRIALRAKAVCRCRSASTCNCSTGRAGKMQGIQHSRAIFDPPAMGSTA
jgi:hypothetical protein